MAIERHDGPVARARSLVGVRFRSQGRSAEFGLDCVGLAASVFGLPSRSVRSDYALRGNSVPELEQGLAAFFRPIPAGEAGAGDLLLVQPGPAQMHILILAEDGYIHADAGQRRVVEVPGAVGWPVISAWRHSQIPNSIEDN